MCAALRHEDCCTLLKNQEDRDILTRKLFQVNMRLFKSSPEYKAIVLKCCAYIRLLAQTEREGYKKPHGFSGANAGIPFNIIALADGRVMINPEIYHARGRRGSLSNCGSLLLAEPIPIWRFEKIAVKYWKEDGTGPHISSGYLPTIQHEVDHNNGILITDRRR